MIARVREIITGEDGRQVGTVGKIEVSPGAPNVIPGEGDEQVKNTAADNPQSKKANDDGQGSDDKLVSSDGTGAAGDATRRSAAAS